MKIFKLPDLGEGLQEAEIVQWHVKAGDEVAVDQPLVSVETAKAIVDIPAPYAGRIVKLYGAEPANFLDVGGGASKEKVQEAFKIILADKAVKGILVNIFGGIMRCDIIAEGVIAAAREMAITVPLVVRLEGTNVELGKTMLKASGLKIIPADDLADAAKKITDEVKKAA